MLQGQPHKLNARITMQNIQWQLCKNKDQGAGIQCYEVRLCEGFQKCKGKPKFPVPQKKDREWCFKDIFDTVARK